MDGNGIDPLHVLLYASIRPADGSLSVSEVIKMEEHTSVRLAVISECSEITRTVL